MNDPRTCVYGHARKFGACGKRGECTRPRGLPCLCGLVKARVPEPMPDKLAQGAASPWTHTYSGKPIPQPWPFPGPLSGTTTGRISSHTPHFEELPPDYVSQLKNSDPEQRRQWLNGEWDVLTGTAQRSLGLEDLDLSKIEERVITHCSECAEFTQAAWDALGRCPWDNWKPGRDVS